jgi:hypothetical protein
MTPALRQLRDGIASHIAESPSVITISRYPLIDNGFGQMVKDTASIPYVFKSRVRIQHESGGVPKNSVTPAGLGTSMSMYVLTDHRSPLEEGDTFEAEGETWTAGPVNKFRKHGGIYKTEAPLIKVEA